MNSNLTRQTRFANNRQNKTKTTTFYQTETTPVRQKVSFGDLGTLTALALMAGSISKTPKSSGGSVGVPADPVRIMNMELLKLQQRIFDKIYALPEIKDKQNYKLNNKFQQLISDEEFIESGGLKKLSREPLAVKVRTIMDTIGLDTKYITNIVAALEQEGIS